MRVKVNWIQESASATPKLAHAYTRPEYGAQAMFLSPRATEWSEAIVIDPVIATNALRDRTRIYVWGRVDYDDIFPGTRHHFTEWCYVIHMDKSGAGVSPRFVAHGDYNRSDEDD
jgi:hypothetical protein